MNVVITALSAAFALPLLYHVYQYINWIYRTWFIIGKAVNKLPGQPLKWPYGNLHQFPGINEKTVPYIKWMAAKYQRVWRSWVGPFVPTLNLCHPDTIRVLVKTEEPKFTEGNAGYVLARPWLGDGLLLSAGKQWKRNRRLLTPAFHFDILKSYMSVYNEEIEILMKKWMMKSEQGQSFDIQTYVSLCTLSVILRCAFSYKEDIQEAGESNPYVAAVLDLSRLIIQRAVNPLARLSDFLFKLTQDGRKFFKHCDYVPDVAENVITQRRKKLEDDPNALENKKYLDFLDILLKAKDEDGTGLTDLEIRNEVDTFLFEGHDTTASGITWTLYSLAKHPEFQRKAQQELDELLADRPNKQIMWEDLGQLPYLTLCIKESMRLWSPVPFISRQITRPLELDGVTIPPNTNINIQILALHHNPAVWGDDHDEYKPDRFLPDNINKMDNFAFLPFSAGPRFDLSVDESHPVYPRPELITRAIHGIKLFVKPRS